MELVVQFPTRGSTQVLLCLFHGVLWLWHFGTCMCSNVETNLSWTCLVSGLLNFEYPSVLLFCSFLYSVGSHPLSSLNVYTFVASLAYIAGAASQAGDADSYRAPGLTSGLQGSVNVNLGALLLVPQWQCISSFVFYIEAISYMLWFCVAHRGMSYQNQLFVCCSYNSLSDGFYLHIEKWVLESGFHLL